MFYSTVIDETRSMRTEHVENLSTVSGKLHFSCFLHLWPTFRRKDLPYLLCTQQVLQIFSTKERVDLLSKIFFSA